MQSMVWDKAGVQGLMSKERSELIPKPGEGPRNSAAFLWSGLFSPHTRPRLTVSQDNNIRKKQIKKMEPWWNALDN